ncbi:HAD-IIIA family hydrolase [Sinorhizobium meliloti]|uniref:HAD-IIIA family hydrolase n=1 Tax=Rhizobium meliloti TaxID=382 RepID=UPI000FD9CF1D|nr:HAD-IIIA family hydrolase [Sinorhizobium meliloti]MDE3801453.1 HAD-IIIA family hydrolase [Sinorhizobium meliloti]MDW9366814.1 HAD-IIIA family hydrolase [Sinorhizobium meliloti]MDW9407035.1 HAD-IIIA family hydrolase [Sinorhizobium meliloti]MDW9428152.1 HAD-IIIA family hydrolase [Sinorhizobium meliloti]MDW9452233.1 HAD-IIIA family hydrolase [Sinorhizobium meliloti]
MNIVLPSSPCLQKADVEGRTYTRPRQAVILAGGRGTRMRPITLDRPKPMVPVLGRPFLEYQIEQLRQEGFERVLLLLGYLPHVVMDHFGDGSRFGLSIEYSVTRPDDLTSSRVSNARHLIDPCFLLLYCDNYWPMRMERLWRRFCAAGKPGMITVYSNKDGYSRGTVILDAHDNVTVFDRLRATPGLQGVEISYAILTDLALELLPHEDTLFEEAIYTPLAIQHRLAGFVSEHRYYSVGSIERLPATERFMRREKTMLVDRDGVLNCRPPRAQYVCSWDEWEWIPGAKQALALLNEAGYRIVIISNQAGIARGAMTAADLEALHQRMCAESEAIGGKIAEIYHCPHGWDDGCDCRKPKPGMLYQAQRDFDLDLTRTLYVGDDDRDRQAAEAADCLYAQVSEQCSLLDLTRQLLSKAEQGRHE